MGDVIAAIFSAGAASLTPPPSVAIAAEVPAELSSDRRVDSVVVTGRRKNLVGEAISASEGAVAQADIASRPLLRTGDLLEFVPGLIATQHSGSGKANQYFLRGFNLDHGTDFATSVDAMPVNMPTHGHGQGYTDLNFLIPETVRELTYRKGVYYADVGDFSSAGSARFQIADTLPVNLAEITVGEYGYRRGVLAGAAKVGRGDLLVGLELQTLDGPWTDIDEDVRKASGTLRYSGDIGGGRGHLMLMGYDNRWNSPDQIPQRAVAQGLISKFGSIDPTVGGSASRYSLSGGWRGPWLGGQLKAAGYAISSKLDLFSNFTYLLDNPLEGDQFEQVDDRRIYGFEVSQQWDFGVNRWRVGAQGRYDDIRQVGLFHAAARSRLDAVRDDAVKEDSLGVFAANEHRFSNTLRSYVGLRYDHYRFDVDARTLAANSGETDDGKASIKASLIYQPSRPLELYASYGRGFHSNDARGVTIEIDPVSGDPATPVTPLVSSSGAEIGARLHVSDRLQATAAAWTLSLDSELLFVGDAGNTEANRPSRRRGVELGLYYFASRNIGATLEVSYSEARFRDDDPAGDKPPGSIPLVVSAGVNAKADNGWLASVQLRYFGRYPLIEDNSVKAGGSALVKLRVGREWSRVGLYVDVLNALESDDHDIDYFYPSRLQGEPAEGVDDVHYHVFQPRTLRVTLTCSF
jgi:outer membrane receptor protein involved in Fe transport